MQNEIVLKDNFNIKDSLKVSEVDNYKLNLDVIFINDKVTLNKKEYFRLFVRPNLSRKNGFDYFKEIQNSSIFPFKTNVTLKSGAIKFYMKTVNGTETIKI
ncbi:hypothetical protein [Spiroplasma taiwanense]|nr:hypothetical protein [Spiroplasma taiwanense]